MLKAIFTDGVDEITVHGLTQWDKGQTLQITLSSLPASFQVHFANKRDDTAYVVEATASNGIATVQIPNLILHHRSDAVAWVYLSDGDSGKTIKTINLPIQARAKPEGYAYTEVEILDYKTLDRRIDALEVGGTGGGLNATASALLIKILRGGVYSEDQSANITALATALGVTEEEDTHTHSYSSAVTTAAGCTTAGVRTYTCSCGDIYTENIPAAGHNYVDGVCTVCGAADPDYSEEVTLSSISATYSGGDVTVGTAVTDLTGIVVTATYSDGSTATVTDYALSGEIAEGENTITVTYNSMSATFAVTGVDESGGEGGTTSSDVLASTTWTEGLRMNASGEWTGQSNWYGSDFISCNPGENYTITMVEGVTGAKACGWGFYDSSQTKIKNTGGGNYIGNNHATYPNAYDFTIPDGAAYFRVCLQGSLQDGVYVTVIKS